MAQQKLLIGKEDIAQCRAVFCDEERMNGFIAESQLLELKNALGDALYYDFMLKIDNAGDGMYAAYQELLQGKVYTYQNITYSFDGIVKMLCYYTLAKIRSNPIQDTRFGAVLKTNDKSTLPSDSNLQGSIAELRGIAISFEERLKEFLERNPSTYPLYSAGTVQQTNNNGPMFFDPDRGNMFNTKSGFSTNGRSI